LWEYLDQWRGLFRRFDQDNSNAIDRAEFATALTSFGYRLTDKFTNLLYASYDKRGRMLLSLSWGLRLMPLGDGQISFDMFVQCMVTLKTLTDVFKQYSPVYSWLI
jgi:Ca2+-binding EF-hand superfamily protein